MNEVQVTVVGMVCSEVKYTRTDEGIATARFQIRSMPRRFDAKRSAWSDGEPSYYSATCWRQLADHVAASMNSGDPVVVHGRLRIDRWKKGEAKMVSAAIDVQAIGHDLRWGTSAYRRGGGPVFVPADGVGAAGAASGGGGGDGGGVGGGGEYAVAAVFGGDGAMSAGEGVAALDRADAAKAAHAAAYASMVADGRGRDDARAAGQEAVAIGRGRDKMAV